MGSNTITFEFKGGHMVPSSEVQQYIQSAYGHLLDRRAQQPRARLDLNTFRLEKGAHNPGNQGCVMEYASALAGLEWGDHPVCVSPMIGGMLRGWNDSLDDDDRQQLRSFAFRALDTNTGDADDTARGWLAVDWLFRVSLATWMEAIGATGVAKHLREMPVLTSVEQVLALRPIVDAAMTFVDDETSGVFSSVSSPVPIRVAMIAIMQMAHPAARALSHFSAQSQAADALTGKARLIMERAAHKALRLSRDFGKTVHGYDEATSPVAAISRELHESALATVAAMCEIGRTPIVETKVRALAKTHDKEAWLDELEAETKASVAATVASADA